MTQYIVTYQKVKYDRNGNGRAVATIYSQGTWESTNTRGQRVDRTEHVAKARLVGYKDSVWEVVDSMQQAGASVILLADMLASVPRSSLPTMKASSYIARYMIDRANGERPHQVIAAIQNHADDKQATKA